MRIREKLEIMDFVDFWRLGFEGYNMMVIW